MTAFSPIILALDVQDKSTALDWVKRVKNTLQIVKVGMRLFYAEGPDLLRAIQDEGLNVFLDLKLYDIPNTVAEACESLAPLKPRFLTIHASGGVDMMQRANAVFKDTSTQLLAVTALTSFTPESLAAVLPGHTGSSPDVEKWVLRLAKAAQAAGLTGLVCSPHEISAIQTTFGDAFTLVTPGVRPAESSSDDQARVMTPEQALSRGASYLVMGRPILQATDPIAVIERIHSVRLEANS